MKAMYKNELARAAGISIDTLRKYINTIRFLPKYATTFENYNKNCKLMTPLQVRVLCEHYDISIDEFNF